ncbi:putative membrane transporter protein [Candidatus Nitrotoga sp. BS]|uniref:sulfite exporter TauE/SafE family protein n=1 Tax=Candidatus Nitrotoga sp. BS TaxID=2890408 RepID=UPI001EF2F517|nr:sulfite exporter TauE/SafE family protein [Candidatus Nitrotoga sp. BS]CAH1201979.1 putative membrane transporter protein [Candidatus Nitrotoga sp. BS]
MDWLYTFSGFVVGFVVGVTGVGGGSLMTPLLVLVFGIAPATAVGTDLLYASLTKMGGIWVHGRRGTVDWKVVKQLAMGSLPAALLSMALLHYLALDEKHLKSLITSVLSVALLLTAMALLFKPYLTKLGKRPDGVMFELHAHHLTGATILTGAVLGVLVTISSVGAGALGVVVLLFLYPRAPMAKIVGTDIAHAVPLTLVAGLGHAALGTVDYGLLGSLLLGSLPGIYLGSHIGIKIPDQVLRPILATMLTAIGVKLMLY